jgi:hypothetical protein
MNAHLSSDVLYLTLEDAREFATKFERDENDFRYFLG